MKRLETILRNPVNRVWFTLLVGTASGLMILGNFPLGSVFLSALFGFALGWHARIDHEELHDL